MVIIQHLHRYIEADRRTDGTDRHIYYVCQKQYLDTNNQKLFFNKKSCLYFMFCCWRTKINENIIDDDNDVTPML